MRHLIGLVLLLSAVSFGTTYFVSPSVAEGGIGSATNTGTATNSPWTCNKMRTTITGGPHTVYFDGGTYTALDTSAVLNFNSTAFTGLVTCRAEDAGNMIGAEVGTPVFGNNDTTVPLIFYAQSGNVTNIKLVGLTFNFNGNPAGIGSPCWFLASGTRAVSDVEFSGCTFNTGETGESSVYFQASTGTIDDITFTDCTIDYDSASFNPIISDATGTITDVIFNGCDFTFATAIDGVRIKSDADSVTGKLSFIDCDFTMSGDSAADEYYSVITTDLMDSGCLFVKGCTFDITGDRKYGISTGWYLDQIYIGYNTFNNTATVGSTPIQCGPEATTNLNPYKNAIVEYNTLSKTDTTTGHGILLGSNYDSAADPTDADTGAVLCRGNILSSFDDGIVAKWVKSAVVEENILDGAFSVAAILVKSANGTKVVHNYIRNTADGAGVHVDLDGTSPSYSHHIYNNMILAKGRALQIDGATAERCYANYNLYYDTDDGAWYTYFAGAPYTSKAAAITAWATLADNIFLNDAYSVNQNPGTAKSLWIDANGDNTKELIGITEYPTDYPAVTDVRKDVSYAGGSIGTLNLPSASDVREGVQWDNGNSTGTLDLPDIADVANGVVFDNETKTGTALMGASPVTIYQTIYGSN